MAADQGKPELPPLSDGIAPPIDGVRARCRARAAFHKLRARPHQAPVFSRQGERARLSTPAGAYCVIARPIIGACGERRYAAVRGAWARRAVGAGLADEGLFAWHADIRVWLGR